MHNIVFISAAGDGCQCQVRFLISFRSRGHKRASGAAAAINTGRWLLWCLGTVGRLKTKELKIILAIGTVYLLLNIFVTIRINKSDYLNGERRGLHKRLIWLIPFLGPMLILRYWTKSKPKFETMTKQQREKSKGDFYESGIGLNSWRQKSQQPTMYLRQAGLTRNPTFSYL